MNGRTIKPPTHQQIAVCAYLIWEKEGCRQGRDLAHWLQAQYQLQAAYLHEKFLLGKPALSTRHPQRLLVSAKPVKLLQEAYA